MLFAFAITGCSKPVPVLLREAEAYRAKGETVSAIIQIKNAVQKAPDDPDTRLLAGTLYANMGQVSEAEKELRHALKLGAPWARVFPSLGTALREMEKFQEILDEFRGDDKLGSAASAEIALLRGRALLGLGNTGRASTEFSLALREKPVGAKLGLAAAALAEGNLASAEKLIVGAGSSSK